MIEIEEYAWDHEPSDDFGRRQMEWALYQTKRGAVQFAATNVKRTLRILRSDFRKTATLFAWSEQTGLLVHTYVAMTIPKRDRVWRIEEATDEQTGGRGAGKTITLAGLFDLVAAAPRAATQEICFVLNAGGAVNADPLLNAKLTGRAAHENGRFLVFLEH